MAVLKDLIVHGNSRFLNGAKFNTINAESIGAEEGIFNKLIATTLDAKTATIDDLTAQNATVVGLLDVQGELHTNAWTNANIANIGGSFYISPTVEPTDGTTTISITRNSATSWTVSASGTFATDFIKSGTATSGVAWPANSLVLITGDVVVGDMVYPLGTLKGTLSAQVTATAASTSKTITITGVTDAQNNNSPSVLQELYEVNNNANISNATFKKGKISLYKLGSNPIGILLSSMGTSSNSLIDIYGGVSTNPNVRIGHLAGLPNVNGSAPTGWGIYTDNGYFSGVIVSTSGKIANFTINGSKMYSNGKTSYSAAATNGGIYIGDDYISFGDGTKTYFYKDGTGQIGPWTLSTTYIRNGNIASATNTSVAGVYLGTDGLNISNGTAATTSYITKTAVNIGNKLTWNGTTLTIDGSASIGGTTASTVVSNAADGAAAKIGLDNLEIGGRNFIPLSSNLKSFIIENASYATATWTDSNVTILNINTTSSTYGIYYQWIPVEPNTTYTLSFTCSSVVGTARSSGGFRKSDNTTIGSSLWNHTVLNYAQVSNGRNVRTFTTPDESATMRVYFSTTNKDSQMIISNVKLEKGNKATDWSPAPEDLNVHKYVTEIDSNGIWVTPSGKKPTNTSTGAGATGTRLNGDGLQIYKAGVQVASYGTDATIGQVAANLYNVFIDADSGIALRKNTTSLLTINSSQIDINNSSGNVMTRVNSSGLTVFDGSGTADTNKIATFGSTTTIGRTSGNKYNIYIDGDAVNLRYNTNVLNKIDANGMNLYDSNANLLLKITNDSFQYPSTSNNSNIFIVQRNDANKYSLSSSYTESSTYRYNVDSTRSFPTLNNLNTGTVFCLALPCYTISSSQEWTFFTLATCLFTKGQSQTQIPFGHNGGRITITYDGDIIFNYVITNGDTILGYGMPQIIEITSSPSYGHGGSKTATLNQKIIGDNSFSFNGGETLGDRSFAVNSGLSLGPLSFSAGGGTAIGYGSTALGSLCAAYGSYSLSGGYGSISNKQNTIALGLYLESNASYQTVFGKYNQLDSDAMFIIGNGTDDNNRSNIFTLKNTGDLQIKDDFKIINTTGDYLQLGANALQFFLSSDNNNPIAQFGTTTRIGFLVSNHTNITSSAFQLEKGTTTYYSVSDSKIYYRGTSAAKTGIDIDYSNDKTSISIGGMGNSSTIKTSEASNGGIAIGDYELTTNGYVYTTATGEYSSARGKMAIATGNYSTSYGQGTSAKSNNQTAIGKYNTEDSSNTYAFIVGNGTGHGARSNAFTVNWNGNTEVSGELILKGSLNIKNTNNFGLTAAEYRHLAFRDTNNQAIGNFEFKVTHDEGKVGWRALIRNWNSSASTPEYTGWRGITCDVARDGTTTWQVISANTFRTAIGLDKYIRSSAGHIDWSTQADGDSKVITKSALAYWNGRFNATGSNLKYSANGVIIGTTNLSSSGNNHTGISISANAGKTSTFTVTRSGYYPICIDRINLGGTGSDKICVNKWGVTARSDGSVTYEISYYNPTSTAYSSITIAVYVLWAKL